MNLVETARKMTMHKTAVFRAGWLLITAGVFGLIVAAAPLRYQMLQVDVYGFNEGLQELGLTTFFFAAYFTILELIVVLVSLGVAALIAWKRPDDWFAMWTAVTLTLFGLNPPLVDGLIFASPQWAAPISLLRLSFYSCVMAFVCLFPNGRFVTRWTRWLLLTWVILSVIAFLNNPLLLSDMAILPNTKTLSDGFWLLAGSAWFTAALIGQLIRYRKHATFIEKQQMKWVLWGFALIVPVTVISILLLISVPSLQNMPANRALYTVVVGGFLLVAALAIPVAIAFSILRYRLWQVDVWLNRTLLYGSLTALITILYMLIVGVLGSLAASEQNTLAAFVLATVMVILGLRPLHLRLQARVNHILPLPSPATSSSEKGWLSRLLLMRIAWGLNALLALVLFGVGLMVQAEQGFWQAPLAPALPSIPLLAGGIQHALFQGSDLYPFVLILSYIQAAAFVSVGLYLFWRKSRDPMGILASSMLIAVGIGFTPTIFFLPLLQPAWHVPVSLFQMGLFVSVFLFLCLFPNGRFFPHWSRYAAAAWLIFTVLWLPFPELNLHRSTTVWPPLIFAAVVFLGLGFQIARYKQLSAAEERQQTKWVIAGFIAANCGLFVIALLLGSGAVHSAAFLGAAMIVLGMASILIPLTIGFALFRYRLWDIDIIVNRTLVYGGLTALITAIYILFVGGMGALVVNRTGQMIGFLLATIIVVIGIRPLYRLLQSGSNRLFPAPAPTPRPFEPPGPTSSSIGATFSQESTFDLIPVKWRLFMRLFLLGYALFALVLLIGALPARLAQLQMICRELVCPALILVPADFALLQQWGVSAATYAVFHILVELILIIPVAILWVIIFNRYADHWVGMLACLALVYLGVGLGNILWAWTQQSEPVAFMGDIIGEIGATALLLLLFLFPDGRFVPRWTRFAAYFLLFIVLPLGVINLILSPGLDNNLPDMINGFSFFFFVLLGTASQIIRYRRYSNPLQRQQTKWVVLGIASFMLSVVLWFVFMEIFPLPPGAARLSGNLIAGILLFGLSAFFPISLGFAILQYRLWDIQLFINRTLVYGGMSLLIIIFYTLVVGSLSTIFRAQAGFLTTLIATGLIAVLFQPVRQHLQRGVNRLMFGERDDPYAALSKLGSQLQTTSTPEATLQSIVETIAATLKLPFVAIQLADEQGQLGGAATGSAVAETIELPLRYQNETVGFLAASPRSPGESFTRHEQKLLADMAAQAGAVAYSVRLTAALQRSREKLVLAREEERRRIRRDLHDELGPTLASQTFALDTALDTLESDPQSAAKLLKRLKRQNQETVADIRRLVYELRPPALDELGLVGTLQAHIAQLDGRSVPDMSISVIPDPLPQLSAAVEVAAYRITLEAINNVVRHAQASRCSVQLRLLENDHSQLRIRVTDDGVGLPLQPNFGVGIHSMRERAEELGGSFVLVRREQRTELMAVLPIAAGI